MYYRRNGRCGTLLSVAVVFTFFLAGTALAEAEKSADRTIDEERVLTLTVGRSVSIKFPRLIKVIDIRTPDTVSARGGRTPDELRVTAGQEPGVGELVVVDETGRKTLIRVRVVPDMEQLRTVLELAFPEASVELHPVSDTSVVLSGYVDDAQLAEQIEKTVQQYGVEVVNALRVGGPQQVQLKLIVAEISRDKLRQLGLDFRYSRPIGPDDVHDLTSTFGFLGALDSVAEPGSLGGPIGGLIGSTGANIAYRLADSNEEWIMLLRALKEEGLAQTLAEPVLVSTSGRPASFLDGGEFAILVPQPTSGGDVTFTVEFRTFGVRLNFLPTVLRGGEIRLQISAEVSEPDQNLGSSFAGSLVPGLRARRAETTVTMHSGQTLAMAGLLHRKRVGRTRKTPFLGDLPLVGAAFRVVEHQEEEREIVIVITPEVVAPVWRPDALDRVPGAGTESPSDKELFLEGRIETLSRTGRHRHREQRLQRSLLRDLSRGTDATFGAAELEQAPVQREQRSERKPLARAEKGSETGTGTETPDLAGPTGYDSEHR